METTEPNVAPITIALRARAAEEKGPGLVKLLREAANVLESYREGWLLRGQRANKCQAQLMAAEARVAELEAALKKLADAYLDYDDNSMLAEDTQRVLKGQRND